jgi:hypothetical protein
MIYSTGTSDKEGGGNGFGLKEDIREEKKGRGGRKR